jgi:pimeloyl-ACP methyl ester carboxylesterase
LSDHGPVPAPLPTVLIPGLYATPRLFAAQLPPLWAHGPGMVADHTRSSSFDAIVASVLAAAPPRFALAGLSMGGALALGVTRAAPERVERLALLSTTARPDDEATKAIRRGAIETLRGGGLEQLVDGSFASLVHPSRVADDGLREIMKDMLRATGADAALRQVEAQMNRPDARPGLGAIDVPALVLVGDADRLAPVDRSEELAAGIAGARLVVVAGCGHLSALERPDEVTRALVAWKSA